MTYCIFFCWQVNHSYELRDKQTTTWVAVQNDGLVLFGHCTCMAGLGEVCSHIGALLYDTLAAVNKRRGQTCTDKACYWLEPNMASVRAVDSAPGSDIQFTKKQRRTECQQNLQDRTLPKTPAPTQGECLQLYKALQETERKEKCAILSIVPGHAERYKPKTITLNLPPSLSSLYNPAALKWSRNDIISESARIYDSLAITQEQVSEYFVQFCSYNCCMSVIAKSVIVHLIIFSFLLLIYHSNESLYLVCFTVCRMILCPLLHNINNV